MSCEEWWEKYCDQSAWPGEPDNHAEAYANDEISTAEYAKLVAKDAWDAALASKDEERGE